MKKAGRKSRILNLLFQNHKNEKGQTLIVIVILMVLALSVGVVVSNRFIKSLRNITETDNASRALAVAEAAVERMLLIPNDTLESYINFGNCGSNCILEITGALGQKVRADVVLSFAGASAEPYELKGKDGEVSQISLNGFTSGGTVDICWDGAASIYASYIYEQSSVVKQNIYAYNPIGYIGPTNGFSNSAAGHGYQNCFTVTAENTPKVLRIKPFNSDPVIFVIPGGGNTLPSQGVLIASTGRAGNAVKVVKVLKTSASAPEYFDYVIYQKSSSDPLSNRPN